MVFLVVYELGSSIIYLVLVSRDIGRPGFLSSTLALGSCLLGRCLSTVSSVDVQYGSVRAISSNYGIGRFGRYSISEVGQWPTIFVTCSTSDVTCNVGLNIMATLGFKVASYGNRFLAIQDGRTCILGDSDTYLDEEAKVLWLGYRGLARIT